MRPADLPFDRRQRSRVVADLLADSPGPRVLEAVVGAGTLGEYLPGRQITVAAFDVPGPAPIAALNQPVVLPPSPQPVAFSGNLSFGLDASGHGFASATNVALGTLSPTLAMFSLLQNRDGGP